MILAETLVWNSTNWLGGAAIITAALLAILAFSYWRSGNTPGVRWFAAVFKIAAILVLALCLLEPLFSGTRARPGANQFAVIADNSQSMTLRDSGSNETRGEELKKLTHAAAGTGD